MVPRPWSRRCWPGGPASDAPSAGSLCPARQLLLPQVIHITKLEPAGPAAPRRYRAGNYKTELPALEDILPGTYYLVEVDARYRRIYQRKA